LKIMVAGSSSKHDLIPHFVSLRTAWEVLYMTLYDRSINSDDVNQIEMIIGNPRIRAIVDQMESEIWARLIPIWLEFNLNSAV